MAEKRTLNQNDPVCFQLATHKKTGAVRAYNVQCEYNSGLCNLSIKNRLRDRVSGSKSRQATGQRFSETNFRLESRTGF